MPTGDTLRTLGNALACLLLAAAARPEPLDPTPDAVLNRAIEALGGAAALESVKELRVVWVGTQDLHAVHQGRFAEQPAPERRQETLILDVPARSGAARGEGVQSDGSPSLWRSTVLDNGGYTVNLKTQRTIPMTADSARGLWQEWTWSVPRLALLELARRRADLRWVGTERTGGRELDVLSIELEKRGSVRIAFDRGTGLLYGYAWEAPYVEGPTAFEYRFKPYREIPGLGLFPSGFRLTIGARTFRDLDVFDARLSKVAGDPWLAPLPPGSEPVLKIVKQSPVSEKVAPGVFLLRNVGGYNVLLASLGPCFAVVDAPASFSAGAPLPAVSPRGSLGKEVLARSAEVFPGQAPCRIVPTHHHGDHFGGVPSLLAGSPGAVLVTSPGNRALAQRLAPAARVETVDGKLVLGEGDGRMEIYLLRGSMHADEILFVYFPAHRIAFEGDLADYVLGSKRLRRFIEEKGLAVDRIYGVHNSSVGNVAELETDDPSN